jgi:hypothetical protein
LDSHQPFICSAFQVGFIEVEASIHRSHVKMNIVSDLDLDHTGLISLGLAYAVHGPANDELLPLRALSRMREVYIGAWLGGGGGGALGIKIRRVPFNYS